MLKIERMIFLLKDYKLLNGIKQIVKRRFSQLDTKFARNLKIEPETTNTVFERRWEVLQEVGDDSEWFKFSIASYNVLSQNLLDNNKRLYKICHPHFLNWQYRKSVLKRELTYYQPDILCMQEVHFNEFSGFFLPELQKLGYFGLYKKRTSGKEDGCATFFRHEKFCLEAFRYLEYHHKELSVLEPDNVGLLFLLTPNLTPRAPDTRLDNPRVDPTLHTPHPPLTEQAKDCLKDFKLCVANTHLLFNPLRGEVKLAQLMMLMAAVDDLSGNGNHATVMCGDFNSIPNSGLYNFALSGRVECKDVAAKFFSGQLRPSPEELRMMNPRKYLSPTFLKKMTSLTDQCQFVDVLKKRVEMNSCMDEEDDTVLSPFSFTQGSGVISHNLQFETVYDHSNYNEKFPEIKEVSFFLEENCCKVDYIFYSQSQNQKSHPSVHNDNETSPSLSSSIPSASSSLSHSSSSSPSSSSLKELYLLRRLKLWTEAEVRTKYPTGMPNSLLGSDHMIMLAEFGVKLRDKN